MIDLLSGLAEAIGRYLQIGLVTVTNKFIEAVGVLLDVVLMLLPDMPAPPAAPVAEWVGWLNWLMPVGAMVAALVAFVAVWVAFLVIKVPLAWVKGL